MPNACGMLQALSLESRSGQQAVIEAVPWEAANMFDYYELPLTRASLLPQTRHDPESETAIVSQSSSSMTQSPFLQEPHLNKPSLREARTKPYATSFELVRNACSLDCKCKCHESFRFRTPGFLDTIFGSLFLGYEASPWSSQGCKNARCRRTSTTIYYRFPRWFVSRTVAVTMSCNQPGSGPEMLLRILQLRPNDARIFVCAHFGYLEEARRLLEGGEASIVDVNSWSCTALHVGSYLT